MATTEIHAITVTPSRAVGYALADKIVAYNSDDEINKEVAFNLIEKNGEKYVCYTTLNSFQNCNMLDPYSTFRDMQEKWQNKLYKNEGKKAKGKQEPLIWHLHQSFDGLEVTPEVANEIGRKLAEEIFKGFSVTISTHCNTDNIHNHFMICAWNNEGKKWNNCNANYQHIRRVSDRLCEEYGLSVLDKTRDVKLIRWEDKDGNIHYYEPTDRKNDLIRKREAGEITTDDVRSYRNTPPYEETQKKKMDNRAEIKADIDAVLPSCRNYDELLERLRELGYVIRDKKKNGEWLAHISFQSPTQDKATREDKIGDGQFYVRENLEKYIAEQARNIEQEQPVVENNHGEDKTQKVIPFFEEYEYGKTNLDEIDDNYKTVYENGEYQTKERTATEKKVLSDIRVKDSEVRGLIDTAQLHRIIAEQGEQRKQKKPYLSKTQEQRLVAQIQSSFRCLQFTEQHHIFSYKQIIDLYSASKAKYDATIDNFEKAEKAIGQLKSILETPQKLSALLDKIESRRNDVSYILEEYNEDKKTVVKYKSIMAKYKIDTPQGLKALEKKVADFETKQNVNRSYMVNIIAQMSELENCIRTFDRIDSERGNRNVKAMREFELIIRPQGEQDDAEQKQENRKQKGHGER